MPDLTWDQAFATVKLRIEEHYEGTYSETDEKFLCRSLRRHIPQPHRLLRIADLLMEQYKKYPGRPPDIAVWLKIHEENPVRYPGTFHGERVQCDKCQDRGTINFGVEYDDVYRSRHALCDCHRGQQLDNGKAKGFARIPAIKRLLDEDRLYYVDGSACDKETGYSLTLVKNDDGKFVPDSLENIEKEIQENIRTLKADGSWPARLIMKMEALMKTREFEEEQSAAAMAVEKLPEAEIPF